MGNEQSSHPHADLSAQKLSKILFAQRQESDPDVTFCLNHFQLGRLILVAEKTPAIPLRGRLIFIHDCKDPFCSICDMTAPHKAQDAAALTVQPRDYRPLALVTYLSQRGVFVRFEHHDVDDRGIQPNEDLDDGIPPGFDHCDYEVLKAGKTAEAALDPQPKVFNYDAAFTRLWEEQEVALVEAREEREREAGRARMREERHVRPQGRLGAIGSERYANARPSATLPVA